MKGKKLDCLLIQDKCPEKNTLRSWSQTEDKNPVIVSD